MALADALHSLLRLPGATYSCVVERDTGRVLAEVGRGEGGAGDGEGVVPYSVARWGTAVAAMFDTTSGDELDDVMITGRRSYHLVRALGPTASVLVYLRLDRARSNLAAARRELAAVRWGAGTGAARPSGAAAGTTGSGRPEPAPSGSAGSGASAGTGAPGVPSRTGGAAPTRAAGTAATRVPAALPPPGTPARGLPVRSAAPASRPVPSEPGTRSSAPQIPLPRRSTAQRAVGQRPAADRRSSGARPSDGPARRRPAAVAAGPMDASAAPAGFAMPAVLGQSWARDPGTLRRLIAGLRRLA